ncbi:MAG TPA: polyprenyl synthetase family protein [Chitinophagales bacterium]|nr:polyprenyl synthetase family protein [Chitinophagales bacterium]
MQTPKQLAELYENFYQKNSFNYDPNGLYEPVRHIMNIPGKRIRPMLLLMACDMFGGNLQEALNAAFAMEVFHNFTLVHDDVMDNADIRRGVPTVHIKYGLNEAILAGDVMLSYGYKYLLNIQEPNTTGAMRLFTKTSIEIFEGQQLDLDFEKRLDVTVDEYLKMIEFKTSVLLAASLQIGALVAGASKEDQEKLYEFGLNLGLSFQIKDDWLDTFGEGEKVGKKIGGDIIQNKKTFLLITALNNASDEQRKQLLALFQEKDETKKVAGVMNVYDALGISVKTESKINELYSKSLDSLRSVNLPDEKKQQLLALAEKIHNRDY